MTLEGLKGLTVSQVETLLPLGLINFTNALSYFSHGPYILKIIFTFPFHAIYFFAYLSAPHLPLPFAPSSSSETRKPSSVRDYFYFSSTVQILRQSHMVYENRRLDKQFFFFSSFFLSIMLIRNAKKGKKREQAQKHRY